MLSDRYPFPTVVVDERIQATTQQQVPRVSTGPVLFDPFELLFGEKRSATWFEGFGPGSSRSYTVESRMPIQSSPHSSWLSVKSIEVVIIAIAGGVERYRLPSELEEYAAPRRDPPRCGS